MMYMFTGLADAALSAAKNIYGQVEPYGLSMLLVKNVI